MKPIAATLAEPMISLQNQSSLTMFQIISSMAIGLSMPVMVELLQKANSPEKKWSV